jgi:hypothetical protein
MSGRPVLLKSAQIVPTFPVRIALVGDLHDILATFQLQGNVEHLGARRRELVRDEQISIAQVHRVALPHQLDSFRMNRVGHGLIHDRARCYPPPSPKSGEGAFPLSVDCCRRP